MAEDSGKASPLKKRTCIQPFNSEKFKYCQLAIPCMSGALYCMLNGFDLWTEMI